jgi:hypothetical protein
MGRKQPLFGQSSHHCPTGFFGGLSLLAIADKLIDSIFRNASIEGGRRRGRARNARGRSPVALRYGVILAEPGNWSNVIGATLSALSEKEKKEIQK